MRQKKIFELIIPDFALGVLINEDWNSFHYIEDDWEKVTKRIEMFIRRYHISPPEEGDEGYFCRTNSLCTIGAKCFTLKVVKK